MQWNPSKQSYLSQECDLRNASPQELLMELLDRHL